MKRIYRSIAAGILICAILMMTVGVQASVVENGASYSISTNSISEWPQGPDIYAETAILMDADTGAIIYNKGMDEKRYPASITKIMTCMLALEHSTLDESVTFTETCLADQVAGSGNAGMQVGEVLTMRQCLLLLMIRSANDVATQIAEHVGGSVEAFVDMMNQKAQELGCMNTHFVNASGMPDDNHYSTAYDMALIFREAIKNDTFREIIGTQSFVIEPTNMNAETRSFSSHHPLVVRSAPEYYEGCFGGKTGVTDSAKNTLVSGAERNGMTLIAVTMRADELGQLCQDQTNMFNYGFDNFSKVEVPGGYVTIPNGKDVAGLKVVETVSGDVTAEAYYYNDDYFVGTGIKEESTQDFEEIQEIIPAEEPEITEQQGVSKENEQDLKQTYRYIIYILGGLIGIALLISVISAIVKHK
ncbi:MAG: D-alanyl-D-alanine carboxypeptidase family protein [Oliverpabstia sp.]